MLTPTSPKILGCVPGPDPAPGMPQGPTEHLLNNDCILQVGSEPGTMEDLLFNKALGSSRAWALPRLQLTPAPALHVHPPTLLTPLPGRPSLHPS